MSLLPVGFGASGDDDYEITDSLRLRSSASAYLNRTFASAGNRKTWTWSAWVKRSSVTSTGYMFGARTSAGGTYFLISLTSAHDFRIESNSETSYPLYKTNALFRDPSAWYHFVVALDMTQATSTNRLKVYVNGVLQTTASYNVPAQNTDLAVNSTETHLIGQQASAGYLDGYLTEVNFIDGQALAPTDFGEYDANGTWKAKEYTGTYGTNGFYLPMKPTTQAEGFNTVLYDGNTQAMNVTGVGFSPDFVWIKNRIAGNPHYLYDSVRGVHNSLRSDATTAEDGYPYQLTSFDADGFSLPTDTAGYNNYAGREYVAWCWDAGSGSAGSNTDGSVTTTVKASDEYGFGIISVPGQNNTSTLTVGHGLSTAPDMVIGKSRNGTGSWAVWHKDLSSASHTLFLNSTAAEAVDGGSPAAAFSAVSSSTITIQNYNRMFGNGVNGIIYAFSEVSGYSKFSSYTGNGSTTGPTITTGFRPGFVMIKSSTSSGTDWLILDGTRSPNNTRNKVLFANSTSAEAGTGYGDMDVSDTGFQIKTNGASSNASGQTYIYMAFAETADAVFNFDASGNKNNFDANNINSNAESESTYDLMKDTPSLVDENAANFATLNPLDKYTNLALSEGNLKMQNTTLLNGFAGVRATTGVFSGKWYWEVLVGAFQPARNLTTIGVDESTAGTFTVGSSVGSGGTPTSYVYYMINGNKRNNGTNSAYGATYTTGDVIGVALDLDNGTLAFYKNGVSQGTAFTGLSGTFSPSAAVYSDTVNGTYTANNTFNFGQRPFKYTPPTGFLKLNTFNLPDSTIEDGSDHFNTVLYNGTGTAQNIDAGLATGFVWIKNRLAGNYHYLYDQVRGAHNSLSTNTAGVEDGYPYQLTSFNTDGFTVPNDVAGYNNYPGRSYAAWNWKANGTGVTNNAGANGADIASTYSTNTEAGFSIVTYTGSRTSDGGETGTPTKIYHGLGKKPEMVITKNRTSQSYPVWNVWHKGYQPDTTHLNYQLFLHLTSASNNAGWQRTDQGFTTNLFCPARYAYDDVNGVNYIAYVFTGIEGYSSFGSYTGNGSTDGTFIYTGFRPSFLIIKRSNAAGSWYVFDSARSTYNLNATILNPNLADAEWTGTNNSYDFLSNGFKNRGSAGDTNASGSTYIYMAFAENPFKNALAR